MSAITILYIALAAIFALGFSFFQYLFKIKGKGRDGFILFFLRSASVFILLLLLINPKITSRSFEVEKPNLVLAVDNSASVAHLGQADSLLKYAERLRSSEELQERFNITSINFGQKVSAETNPEFNEPQTDINSALENIGELFKRKSTAVILMTDGNQSLGRDYSYFQKEQNQRILPLVIGDTTRYADLYLSNLNVNRYAFLNNRFPVEAIVNYTGDEPVTTKFQVKAGESVLYSRNLELSKENNSVLIETTLPATGLGVRTYQAVLTPGNSEKNLINNAEKFAVEVIDERTNILLLSSITHPDLGAIKQAVESNKQRNLEIRYLDNKKIELKDYQLVVMYQPNLNFKSVLEQLESDGGNVLLVTGTQTNWNFVNNNFGIIQKNYSSQPQEIFAVMNPNFGQFQFEDIGFSGFPPLVDKFGNLSVNSNSLNSLLYQKIEGMETRQPLIAIAENGNRKTGFLFGENIWRWRAASYLETKSFEEFDDFFGKIIQNLSSQKKRERLSLDYKSFYYGNEEVELTAQYFDENYNFDPGASLSIRFKAKESEEYTEAPFLLRENYYELKPGNLPEGGYEFTVSVEGSNIKRSGTFSIIDFDVEQQFNSANLQKLKLLANNNEEQVYYPDKLNGLITELVNDEHFTPVQKSREKSVPLIDWYYLLFLLAAFLAAEWFFRKYKGLI
ncbi:vWA domain-containing protein [Salegentibacter chungangensis]|uniref:VWA domain-containing protein n=1 Tax=Salegentibacter chungangensis TaxID=1335724 RepID=A0ABW3NU53_9FLAO